MLRFLLIPALLAASSPSSADTCICNHAPAPPPATTKGCKLVVRDFDGPTKLADASRGVFMKSLGLKYEVVPLKQWDAAFEQKPEQHGVRRWQAAAKRAGVSAVVEGWLHDEGLRHTMTISVRDASTGSEIDSVSVKVSDKGVAEDPANLLSLFNDMLDWGDCKDPQQVAAPLIF
jgi:hypothetical protein